jgi:hypothetical protein
MDEIVKTACKKRVGVAVDNLMRGDAYTLLNGLGELTTDDWFYLQSEEISMRAQLCNTSESSQIEKAKDALINSKTERENKKIGKATITDALELGITYSAMKQKAVKKAAQKFVKTIRKNKYNEAAIKKAKKEFADAIKAAISSSFIQIKSVLFLKNSFLGAKSANDKLATEMIVTMRKLGTASKNEIERDDLRLIRASQQPTVAPSVADVAIEETTVAPSVANVVRENVVSDVIPQTVLTTLTDQVSAVKQRNEQVEGVTTQIGEQRKKSKLRRFFSNIAKAGSIMNEAFSMGRYIG